MGPLEPSWLEWLDPVGQLCALSHSPTGLREAYQSRVSAPAPERRGDGIVA